MLVVVFTTTKVALLLLLTQRERQAHALPSNVAVPALGLYLAQSDQHR